LRRLFAELFLEAREETNRTENIKLFMCLPWSGRWSSRWQVDLSLCGVTSFRIRCVTLKTVMHWIFFLLYASTSSHKFDSWTLDEGFGVYRLWYFFGKTHLKFAITDYCYNKLKTSKCVYGWPMQGRSTIPLKGWALARAFQAVRFVTELRVHLGCCSVKQNHPIETLAVTPSALAPLPIPIPACSVALQPPQISLFSPLDYSGLAGGSRHHGLVIRRRRSCGLGLLGGQEQVASSL
jgi:hypothetical protein